VLTEWQMYKSVSIRDSRQSLELNASLWRLSWITFIFLPLTFLVGFFGMNVGMFEHYPSVKYYFISAIPLVRTFSPLRQLQILSYLGCR
jgi:Mg2+ and Co2+ transporter CorA